MMSFDMPSASVWLDRLREAKGFTTDAECANFLEVPKQAVSQWRHDQHQMGVLDSLNVGEAIGVNPLFVVICNTFNSTRDPDKRTRLIQHAVPLQPKVPPIGETEAPTAAE